MRYMISAKETVNADLEPSVNGVGSQSSFFWANFPLMEELRDMIRHSFEVQVTALTSF